MGGPQGDAALLGLGGDERAAAGRSGDGRMLADDAVNEFIHHHRSSLKGGWGLIMR